MVHGIGRRGGGVREAKAWSFGTWVATHTVERPHVSKKRVERSFFSLSLVSFFFYK